MHFKRETDRHKVPSLTSKFDRNKGSKMPEVYYYKKTDTGFVTEEEFYPNEEWKEVLASCGYDTDTVYLGTMHYSERDSFHTFPMQEKCPECGSTMSGKVYVAVPRGAHCRVFFYRRCDNSRNRIERK